MADADSDADSEADSDSEADADSDADPGVRGAGRSMPACAASGRLYSASSETTSPAAAFDADRSAALRRRP